MNYFLLHDKETGGLEAEKSDVLTAYYAIVDEDLKILEEIYLKLKPDGDRLPIAEAGALRVNGIDLRLHMADPETITYSQAKVLITNLIRKYLKKKGRFSNIRCLGYNVDFDIAFEHVHLLSKEEWNSMIHYVNVDPKRVVDFLKDAGWFPKEIGSLTSVVDYLGIPKRAAHNCKEDSIMTLEVWKVLLDLMRSKKENGSSQDLISLLEAE